MIKIWDNRRNSIYRKNAFVPYDTADSVEEHAADRADVRIRKITTAKKMSRPILGELEQMDEKKR